MVFILAVEISLAGKWIIPILADSFWHGGQVLDGSGGKVKVGVECGSSGDDGVLVFVGYDRGSRL